MIRDERYKNPLGPFVIPPDASWAKGCGVCEFGLINPPAYDAASPLVYLYEQRCAQAEAGELTFCTCRAGRTYAARYGMKPAVRDAPTVHWEGHHA